MNEATKQGKAISYAFALICSIFLAYQCYSSERRNEQISVTTWMPCLLLIGAALGVNINPSDLVGFLDRGKQ